MAIKLSALHTNRLVTHPAYAKILAQYNERLQTNGKVNNKKFYEEVIVPALPGYALQTWYSFLKRFVSPDGIIAAEVLNPRSIEASLLQPSPAVAGSGVVPTTSQNAIGEVRKTIASNQDATARGIQLALNIGNDRLKEIIENPQLMSAKDAIDLLFKAMKAQDGRVRAIGKVREDNREQEKFDRAFDNEAYG